MLQAFTFGNGRVGYANRYLRSPAYNDDNAEGRIVHDEYATDPCRSLFGRIFSYFILAEIPLKSPGALDFPLGNEPYADKFRWVPEEGTRIIVVDKDTGEVAAQKMTEPFFAFHHVNAFERDGEVVMDISAYEDTSIIDELYLDNLRGEDAGVSVESRLRRYRIPLGPSGKVTSEQISDTSFELPGYDYQRYAGQPYSVVWGSGTGEGTGGFHNQLVKIHTDTGETKTWHEENMYPSEPVFVRAPGASGEEDGVLLSLVLDGDRGDSFLLVLEPATMEERARARLPQHVPFGFHGQYFDNVSA
jgi:carotenoid cleavage dioxygenase-like enzyme